MCEPKPGWKRHQFGDMVTSMPRNARGLRPREVGVDRYVALEHLDSNSLKIRRWGSPDNVGANSDLRHFEPGDVILARRGIELRKVGVAEFRGVASGHALVFRAKPDVVLPAFLPFFMQSDAFMMRADRFSVGSLSRTVNLSALTREEFALPPLEEQVIFARVLGQLSRLHDELAQAHALGETVLAALLENHFTRHANPNVSVLERAQTQSGGTPARGEPKFWSGAVPWLSPKDMKRHVVAETSEHITEEAVASGYSLAPAGTTFVVVRGMILQHSFPVCRSTVPMAFNQDVKAFLPKEGLEAAYLSLWFRWAAPRLLRLVSATSHGTKRLESDRLKTVPFSNASLAAQQAFLLEFDAVNDALATIDSRREVLDRVRKSVLAKMKPT